MKIHMEREVAGKVHRVGLKRKSVVLVMFSIPVSFSIYWYLVSASICPISEKKREDSISKAPVFSSRALICFMTMI